MKRIQKGATETIYLTARDENNEVAIGELEGMVLDALIVQKSDITKFVHITNVTIDSDAGYAYFSLTTDQTASLDGVCNFELRDTNSGVKIAVKQNAFTFEDNVIHTQG